MKYITFLLVVSLFACESNNNRQKKTGNDIVTKNESKGKSNDLQNQNLNFQEFWSGFRKAIINSDSLKLIELCRFPITIHGDQDEDPLLKIDKSNFYSFFNSFLSRSVYIKNMEYLTNLELIKKTDNAEKCWVYSESETWRRVGDLEFEKMNDKWALTLIYYPTVGLKK